MGTSISTLYLDPVPFKWPAPPNYVSVPLWLPNLESQLELWPPIFNKPMTRARKRNKERLRMPPPKSSNDLKWGYSLNRGPKVGMYEHVPARVWLCPSVTQPYQRFCVKYLSESQVPPLSGTFSFSQHNSPGEQPIALESIVPVNCPIERQTLSFLEYLHFC